MSNRDNPARSSSMALLLLALQRPEGDDTTRNWAKDGLCAQADPELFYPRSKERGSTTRTAKQVCSRCPIAADCLEYALETGEEHGIWGGTTARERDRIRARRAVHAAVGP